MTVRLWFFITALLMTTHAVAGPDELLERMQRLQQSDCDLACNIEIASLYSDRFLIRQRDVVITSLQDQATRREILLTFFGETFDLRRFDHMSPAEFFGRQLWHTQKSAPKEFLMREIRIVSQEEISEQRVDAVVELSGMEADPKYKEEGLMRFVLTDDGWKIDEQH